MHRVTFVLVLATVLQIGLTFEEADLKSSPSLEHDLSPFTTDELVSITEDSRTNQGISSPNIGVTEEETHSEEDGITTEEPENTTIAQHDEETTEEEQHEENPLVKATQILEDTNALLNDEPQSTEKNITEGELDKTDATVKQDAKDIKEQSETLDKLADAVSDVTTEKVEEDATTKTHEEMNAVTTTTKPQDQTTAEQKSDTTAEQKANTTTEDKVETSEIQTTNTSEEAKETTTAAPKETSEAAQTSENVTTESSETTENRSTIAAVTEKSSDDATTTEKGRELPTIIGPTIAVISDKKPDEKEIQVPKAEESPVLAGDKPDGDKVDAAKSDAGAPKWEKKTEEPNKKGKSMAASAADSSNDTKANEPAQHESTVEDTKTAGPSKDTTILVFLFVAVVIVGAIAFGYNFVKKRKQRTADLERAERGQSSFKRSLQSLTKQEPEQEMKPLIKDQEMVVMKKSYPQESSKPNGEPSAPAKT